MEFNLILVKKILIIPFLICLSCNNIEDKLIGSSYKLWSLRQVNDGPLVTYDCEIWVFTEEKDEFYVYEIKNSIFKLYDSGDKHFENKFKIEDDKTIIINGGIYELLELTDNTLILREDRERIFKFINVSSKYPNFKEKSNEF